MAAVLAWPRLQRHLLATAVVPSTILLQLLSHLQRSQLLYLPFHQLLIVFDSHLLLQVLL